MKISYHIIIVFILLLQGCGKDAPPQKIEASVTTSIIEKLGFVKNINKESNKYYAEIDFIDYIKNSEIDSTIIDTQRIEVPNGYSYVNKEIENKKIAIADSAKIILQTFSFNNDGNFNFKQSVGVNEIAKALLEKKDNIFLHSPFRINISNNKIISLTEIYIP